MVSPNIGAMGHTSNIDVVLTVVARLDLKTKEAQRRTTKEADASGWVLAELLEFVLCLSNSYGVERGNLRAIQESANALFC